MGTSKNTSILVHIPYTFASLSRYSSPSFEHFHATFTFVFIHLHLNFFFSRSSAFPCFIFILSLSLFLSLSLSPIVVNFHQNIIIFTLNGKNLIFSIKFSYVNFPSRPLIIQAQYLLFTQKKIMFTFFLVFILSFVSRFKSECVADHKHVF